MSGLLIAAFGALPAHASAVYYTIDFTITSGSTAPTSGSFDYDSTLTDSFSNFIVLWDGLTFNLTSAANSPAIFASNACIGANTGALATFDELTCSTVTWSAGSDGADVPYPATFALIDSGNFATFVAQAAVDGAPNSVGGSGSLTITGQSTVPEPGTTALMLLGLGCLLLTRKRLARS